MADLNRPDYGQVWASTGEKVAPDTVKMQSGWVQEMMPFQYENYLQARQDEAIVYLLQKGVPEYSSTQEYIANKSVVVYQGNLYMATATVTNILPTVTASWKRLNVPLATNGTVPVSSGGTGATTASEARTNLGLGSIATSTAPATNGIVVKDANDSLVARLITGTSGNIAITNPDGVAGNININVGSNVAQLSQDSSWTSKGGIRLPSGSTGERGIEVAGKIRYNTTLQKFEGFDGTSWNALGASSNIEITTLSGNGVTTNFTLNSDVFSAVATDVYIGGIYQNKSSYSVSGSTITFSEAPVAGVDNIQVLSRRVVDLGLSTATQVSIQDTTNLYTSSTVEGALREVGDKAKYVKNAILSFPDYAAASAAAVTLPDGQVVDAVVNEATIHYVVAAGALIQIPEREGDGPLNVRKFITSLIDGTTSNQSGIVAAVAAAYASGADLYWPRGTHVSDANIPNFWNVNHIGPGVIKRGANTWFITPKRAHTNTIYLSPVGGGDGLTPAHGMSVDSMPNALRSLGPRASNGSWRVLFTAGTYTDNGIQPSFLPTFTRGLTLEGEMSGTTHLSVWDGSTSSSAYAVRIDLVSLPQMLTVKNMRFINWTADPSNAGAIVAWGGHNLVTENCRIENCSIGIWTSRNSQHRSRGDYIDGCSTFGIGCQYSSSVIVGLSDKRTIIKNCGWGLHLGRASVCHNDYADFEGNQYDLYVTQNSRIVHVNPTFKNWAVASHFIQNGAVNEAMDVCIFDAASISDAKPILLTSNSPIIDVVEGVGTEVLHTNYAPSPAFTLTGTTDETLLTDKPGYGATTRFPRNLMFCGRNLYVRFQARVQGTNTGTGATFRIAGHGSSASLDILTFSLPSGGYTGFIEAHIEFRDDGTALAYGTLTTQSGVVFASKTMTPSTRDLLRDKTNTKTLWRLYAKLVNIADNFTLHTQKTWVTV